MVWFAAQEVSCTKMPACTCANIILFLYFFSRKDKLFFVETPLREGHAISDKLAMCWNM